jgi:hypothetical protein
MKILQSVRKYSARHAVSGFSLTETVIAVALSAIMVGALYACCGFGFKTIEVTREDLKASQIMLSRLEAIRLCTFSQVTNPTNNPATFTEYFDSKNQKGVVYNGTFSAALPPVGTIPEGYRTNMLLVSVGLSWTSDNIARYRNYQTYVARDGIEGYISAGR